MATQRGRPLTPTAQSTPRLKYLELQGYKTFASKIVFEFAPTITAIVGPNGSGKSNIADSIRWVLGEQSYSLLRGKRTEDMIFSGSEARSRASMASAAITFDNADGWLPIDFEEVSIGRRAYRDGQNEYLLNGQRVRLRDVSELLAQCGLAERTYTIIGQGLVDAALSLKAEERRRLFEEAAGLGLYRGRREEALRRLEATRHNLERVRDILGELRPRLRSLERQAALAQDYDKVKEDLEAALRVWHGYHWFRQVHLLDLARERADELGAGRDRLRDGQTESDRELATVRARLAQLRGELQSLSQDLSSLYAEREVQGKRLAVAQERKGWLTEQTDHASSEITALEASILSLTDRLADERAESARLLDALTGARRVVENLRAGGAMSSADREALQHKETQARQALETAKAQRAEWAGRLRQLDEQLQATLRRRRDLEASIESGENDLRRAETASAAARALVNKVEAAVRQASEAFTDARDRAMRAQDQSEQLTREVAEARTRWAAASARLDTLRATGDGAPDLHSNLADAADRGELGGWIGRLGRVLETSAEIRVAVSAALGEFRDALTFRGLGDLDAALRWMTEKAKEGSAALLPLRELHVMPRLDPIQDPDCLGNAAALTRVPDDYRQAIDVLLGRTLIVRDRAAARRLAGSLPADARLVTLAGDVFHPAGHVMIGAAATRVDGQMRARAEADVSEAEQALKQTEGRHSALASRIGSLRSAHEAAQHNLEIAKEGEREARLRQSREAMEQEAAHRHLEQVKEIHRTLLDEETRLEQERRNLLEQGSVLEAQNNRLAEEFKTATESLTAVEAHRPLEMVEAEAQLQVIQRSVEELNSRVADLSERLERRRQERTRWAEQIEAAAGEQARLSVSIDETEEGLRAIEAKLTDLNSRMRAVNEGLSTAEGERAALEEKESRARMELRSAEQAYSQAQIELARREEELSALKRRIEDDFGLVAFDFGETAVGQEPLPFEGLVERLPRVDELPLELESQVNRLRNQLRRMGAVSPEARREHAEVKERVEFLTAQVDDLKRAEVHLQEVITELDQLMEHRFRQTFDEVAAAFKETFTRLFGGGSVRLTLTDPQDVNLTGIDIEARLPGRREQGLSMLSGGERSLTACALVFSLLRVSPTPFCILDEVDAMLDEANVSRFRDLLRELSAQTQFLIITHNRQTVQAAEVVYGVSMGPDSASKVISLKLDEAAREVAA
jgi:chromosome segregation protein